MILFVLVGVLALLVVIGLGTMLYLAAAAPDDHRDLPLVTDDQIDAARAAYHRGRAKGRRAADDRALAEVRASASGSPTPARRPS